MLFGVSLVYGGVLHRLLMRLVPRHLVYPRKVEYARIHLQLKLSIPHYLLKVRGDRLLKTFEVCLGEVGDLLRHDIISLLPILYLFIYYFIMSLIIDVGGLWREDIAKDAVHALCLVPVLSHYVLIRLCLVYLTFDYFVAIIPRTERLEHIFGRYH